MREDILRELGLSPRWREKTPRAPSPLSANPPSAAPASRAEMQPPPPAAVVDESTIEATIAAMGWGALESAVAQCRRCPLCEGRTKTVFGVGDVRAPIFFVGEGPGRDEDLQGEPFVGRGGQLLDRMLAAIDRKRGDGVYIANIVKCRPPKNRNPAPAEAAACLSYLRRQIELVSPRLIVAMGRVAASHLLGGNESIANLRQRLFEWRGTALVVTYHPAYLLRNPADKRLAWEDLCFLRKVADED